MFFQQRLSLRRRGVSLAVLVLVTGFAVSISTHASAAGSYGPSNAAYAAYYANPSSSATWAPFCAGADDGASYSGVSVLGVPACGPTPTNVVTNIYVGPSGAGGPIPDFQCVELAERYLWVTRGFAPINGTNGDQVVAHYAAAHSLPIVANGSGQLPEVGAVMSFANSSAFNDTNGDGGHVAIVSAVTAASVTVVGENQNGSGPFTDGSATMQVTGNDYVNDYVSSLPNIEWINPTHVSSGTFPWTNQMSPLDLSNPNGLGAVSCPLASFCMAVGAETVTRVSGKMSTTGEAPRTATWNGIKWTRVPFANIVWANVTDVSCLRPSWCEAVAGEGGTLRPLPALWNGRNWSIQSLALGPGWIGGVSIVSCVSTSWCVAIGFRAKSSGHAEPLFEIWNGRSWSIQTAPKGGNDIYFGLSCTTLRFCMAAGFTIVGGGANQTRYPIIAQWNGQVWTRTVVPSGGAAELNDVSCASASACMAVGENDLRSGFSALADEWNQGKWTRLTSLPTQIARFTGVTCLSAKWCLTTGVSSLQVRKPSYFSSYWNGSVWSTQLLLSDPLRSTSSDVACAATTDCEIVGNELFGFHI